MTQTPVLIEPSLADAIAIITTSAELPEQTRRHWATSLRQIAKAFDKPLEMIPARYSESAKISSDSMRCRLVSPPRHCGITKATRKAPCSGWRGRRMFQDMERL
jgi:hypothetical protein